MKTIKRTDHWHTMVHDSHFLFSLLAIALIGLMLFDFLAIIIFSTLFFMAYLEFKKRMALYSSRKQNLILVGIFISFIGFFLALFFGLTSFFATLNQIPEANSKSDLMRQVVEWLAPLKQTLTGVVAFFLNDQDAVNLVNTKITETISAGAELLVGSILHIIASIPEIILALVVFGIGFYVVARNYRNAKFKIFMYTQSLQGRQRLKTLFKLCELSAYDAIICTFVVAMAQGAIIGLGALITGLSLWPMYLVVGFAFSFVPVVGLLPIIAIGCFHAYMLYGISSLIIFACVGAFASTTDNILRLVLLSQSTSSVNSFISFFCLIGSLSLFGLKGLILGPFLLSLAGYLLSTKLPEDSLETK